MTNTKECPCCLENIDLDEFTGLCEDCTRCIEWFDRQSVYESLKNLIRNTGT